MSKDNPNTPVEFNAQEEITKLKEVIDIQNAIIQGLQEAVESLNTKIDDGLKEVSSIGVTDSSAKKEKPRDPGPVKVGDKKYRFKLLKFRLSKEGGGLITYTAEEASRDPEVLKTCLSLGILKPE